MAVSIAKTFPRGEGGRGPHRFAVNPAAMGQVLGIVTRAISSHLISAAGYHHAAAQTGAVTLIQRFGSALNLNIHFHMLFLDGVYVTTGE